MLGRHRRKPGEVVDDAGVRGPGRRHDRGQRAGIAIGFDRGLDGAGREPVVGGGDDECIHLQ